MKAEEINTGKRVLFNIGLLIFFGALHFGKWWLLIIATIFTFLAIVMVPWAEDYEE